MSELPNVINVDFDRTLTMPEGDEWQPANECEPYGEMVGAIRNAYFNGSQVIVWTARQWNEAPKVAGWLTAHEVPYHGLKCGKGGSECYVDDKAMTPDEFMKLI